MTLRRVALGILAGTALLAQSPGGKPRFDAEEVRNDIFSTLAFNVDALQGGALQRGMMLCEQALAENPNFAEALVWRGVGEFVLAGTAFIAEQDQKKGAPYLKQGLEDLNRAVQLEPDNVAVRIPRGTVFMQTTRSMEKTNFFYKPFLENARSDYQRAFDSHKDHLDTMGTHELGELLQGLGDLNSRQGKAADAEQFYRLMQQKLPNTEYAKRAAAWLATKQPLQGEQTGCIGCHTSR